MMKFKTDENLPVEVADDLRQTGRYEGQIRIRAGTTQGTP